MRHSKDLPRIIRNGHRTGLQAKLSVLKQAKAERKAQAAINAASPATRTEANKAKLEAKRRLFEAKVAALKAKAAARSSKK